MSNQKVLFLCTGNSARSQMAEAFLRKYGNDKFDAFSAGTEPKPIHPMAVKVMKEVGIDISSQNSKDLKLFLGKQSFAYAITLCPRAQESCPYVFPGVLKCLDWTMDDPASYDGTEEERLIKFREARDTIEQKIRLWLQEVE